MKTWIQMCAVIILASQVSACGGGGDAAPTAPGTTAEVNIPAQPSVELATTAQVKALTEAYNAAQALWANTAPANYHYNFKAGGSGGKFDSYVPVTIWVRDGKMSQVTSGVQVLRVEDYQYASIEQLFAMVANTLGKGAVVSQASVSGGSIYYTVSEPQGKTQNSMEFDPLLGFPKTATSSRLGCCDDAWKMQVTEFTIDQ